MVAKLALFSVLVLLGLMLTEARGPKAPGNDKMGNQNRPNKPGKDKTGNQQNAPDQDNMGNRPNKTNRDKFEKDRENINRLMTDVRQGAFEDIKSALTEIMSTENVEVPESILIEISDLEVSRNLQRRLRWVLQCQERAIEADGNVDRCLKKLMRVITMSQKKEKMKAQKKAQRKANPNKRFKQGKKNN